MAHGFSSGLLYPVALGLWQCSISWQECLAEEPNYLMAAWKQRGRG